MGICNYMISDFVKYHMAWSYLQKFAITLIHVSEQRFQVGQQVQSKVTWQFIIL